MKATEVAGTFDLVYQAGIANVFHVKADGLRRVYQGDFHSAEMICRGVELCGGVVLVYHCDKAGDIAQADWLAGAGDLFSESKRFIAV